MATGESFKDFVLENLNSALENTPYSFSARKMFGEYCIYVIDRGGMPKPIFLLCDEVLYVKCAEILKPILQSAPLGFAYPGAKESYILDVESFEILREVVLTLAPTLPTPKPKKPRNKRKLTHFICSDLQRVKKRAKNINLIKAFAFFDKIAELKR